MAGCMMLVIESPRVSFAMAILLMDFAISCAILLVGFLLT